MKNNDSLIYQIPHFHHQTPILAIVAGSHIPLINHLPNQDITKYKSSLY